MLNLNDYSSINIYSCDRSWKEISNYSLSISPEGNGIYINDGTSPELIAIVAGINLDILSLDNSSQFIFD